MVQMNGPQITPRTMNNQGGGNALPPYPQMRTQTIAGSSGRSRSAQPSGIMDALRKAKTKPVVTPKSTVMPGEVKQTAPPMTPAAQKQPPQAGGQTLSDVYNFFKSDLENERRQAISGAQADAAKRGVYYGTPLTGSEADIETQFLRGLGQLQSGMYSNEQENQLRRLGLASGLLGGFPEGGYEGDNSFYQVLGQLFGSSPTASGARRGPAISTAPPARLPPPTTQRPPIPVRGPRPQPVGR